MVVLSAVGSGCVITQNVEVTCMRQHKRTNLLETYLPVGTFQNELFYVTGPCLLFFADRLGAPDSQEKVNKGR